MALQVYNTLTRGKEPLETIEAGKVRIYVCGVTVYDSAHVGHAMSSLVFDMIRRYLTYRGYEVRYVQNFTDVDDKVIVRGGELGVSPFELADRYVREFLVEMSRLGVLPADANPRVTVEMPRIIDMIEKLVGLGHAYAADNGDVYFSVATFPGYGRLSRRPTEEAESQEPPSSYKRAPQDFALWKAAKPDEPWWDSPWGRGRPGWHIECSAMAAQYLGEHVDIHGGGMDLIFPHHENEIAQSESACQCAPFVRYWLHNGMLQLGDEKMSKSLGNIVPIATFLQSHEGEALRLFVLSSHYRGSNTLTDESIAAAERGLERLRGAMRPPRGSAVVDGAGGEPAPAAPGETGPAATELAEAATQAKAAFIEAMDDDFGTPSALAALFGLVTAINKARDAGVAGEAFHDAQATLDELATALGFGLRQGQTRATASLGPEPFIQLLIDLRNEARASKDWSAADRVRDRLQDLGVALEDTASGTEWRILQD